MKPTAWSKVYNWFLTIFKMNDFPNAESRTCAHTPSVNSSGTVHGTVGERGASNCRLALHGKLTKKKSISESTQPPALAYEDEMYTGWHVTTCPGIPECRGSPVPGAVGVRGHPIAGLLYLASYMKKKCIPEGS